ncbi:hypothetical protein ACIGO9_28570 [Nocardia asteroides]|uniref:hypothetical protein n=1 Tax=Nocardia asteroides TaxID=1824 RepID=UPI0037C7D70D
MFTIALNEDGVSVTVSIRHCDGTVSDVVIGQFQCGVLDVEVDPATSVRPNVTMGAKDMTKMHAAAEVWEHANEEGSAEAVKVREAAEAEACAAKSRELRAERMNAAIAATQVLFRYTISVTHAALFDRAELDPILAEMRSTLGEVDEHELLAKLDQAGMLVDRSKEKACSSPVLRSFDLEGM